MSKEELRSTIDVKPLRIRCLEEWARQESNLRLPPCEDGTLAAELRAHQRRGFVEN